MAFDAVDAALVRGLRRDGRATVLALAASVGLTHTTVGIRVHRLLERGVIRVVGVLHPRLLGIGAIGHAALTVDGAVRPVADRVAALPAVRFASLTTGPYPLRAEVRAVNDGALSAQIDGIRRIPQVRGAEVFRVVEVVKDPYVMAGADTDIRLDEIDWLLLHELQRDGRATAVQLAGTVGLSHPSTRVRLVRLLDAGVIRVVAIPGPAADTTRLPGLATELVGFGIAASGTTGGPDALASQIADLKDVRSVVRGFGRYDILGHVEADSRAALPGVLDTIRAVPGVTIAETWHHLDINEDTPPDRLGARRPRRNASRRRARQVVGHQRAGSSELAQASR